MMYFKSLPNYEYCLITTGGACVYGFNGELKQSGVPLEPKLMNGAIKCKGVSLLVFNGGEYEIATEDSINGLRKYTGTEDVARIIADLTTNKDYIVQLKNKGKEGTVRYRQTMFIYNENYDLDNIVSRYNLTLVG